MPDEEIRSVKMSGIAKTEVQKLVKQEQDYITVGITIIKDNFI